MRAPARLTLHGALRDFLPRGRRATATAAAEVPAGPSVKDALEALGPPHPEVDVLLLDGRAVGFGVPLPPGAHLEAFPHGWPWPASQPRPAPAGPPLPPGPPRFVVDVGLAPLAQGLRLLGFDALWRRDAPDAWLARVAHDEGRALLTRDVGLLKRAEVHHGHAPRPAPPLAQLLGVARRFALAPHLRPFTRCTVCNGPLAPLAPEAARARVPPRVALQHAEFRACTACGRVYWPGSHHARLAATVEQVAAALAETPQSDAAR